MTFARRIEQRIRAAERRVADAYGLRMSEEVVTLAAPAVRVRVLTSGSGEPVVYINGISAPALGFAPLIGQLPGYRHILIDLPGHSLAPPYRWRDRPVRELAVHIVTGVLDALGLRDARFVGSSLGGLFGLWLALDAPDRITRAALLGSPATALPGTRAIPEMVALTSRRRGPVEQRLMALPAPRFVARLALAGGIGPGAARSMSADLVDLHRLPLRLPGQAASYRALLCRLIGAGGPLPGAVLTPAELARIAVPAVFVWGDQDAFLAPEAARDSIGAMRHARLEVVPGGHNPWFDDPAWCASHVRDLLGHQVSASAPPFRAVVKADAGGPPRPRACPKPDVPAVRCTGPAH